MTACLYVLLMSALEADRDHGLMSCMVATFGRSRDLVSASEDYGTRTCATVRLETFRQSRRDRLLKEMNVKQTRMISSRRFYLSTRKYLYTEQKNIFRYVAHSSMLT